MDNLNKLVGFLKNRLYSYSKKKSTDEHNNVIYVDCDIFDNSMLESFIELSLSNFNQTPIFSNFSLDGDLFVNTFADVLVEGAVLYALASKALIERGREFKYIDNGISFDPPSVADMLQTQYSVMLMPYYEKLKLIKSHINEFNK